MRHPVTLRAARARCGFSIVLVLALATTTGCAAVFKGSQQSVRFDAVPQGADVRVDNRYLGETPVEGPLDRNQSQDVRISKDGFADQHVRLRPRPDTPWWFWDIGTCVLPIMLCVPLLVDAVSGAWYSLDDEIRVKLEPREQPRPSASPAPPPPSNAAGY